ncbi:phosphoinositide 3-kinase regulatory subunit 5 isoform X2 [Osmerus eperlanus]|uniref:phosphoinositide 3-kinase regulatory subunit 5 isoform X2 n=1 Tax=Osmerus eperlanus TaxID=29151 RepID=UPI002E1247EE
MQYTSCTEDRIQHAFNRCLDGLRNSPTAAPTWNVLMCSAGQSMNRWSLEELVKREPEYFLILLQQIIRRTKEVLEQCQYELVAPLAIMFSSTLLQTPYCPADTELLKEAVEVFRCFLTWPEPYCSVCKSLLSTLHQEIKAPGISFHRMVREEQGLTTSSHRSKTITVLLMNPGEVPADFLSVAEQLSGIQHSRRDVYITLVKHAYQAAMGTKYALSSIHQALQAKSVDELEEIFAMVTDILETAATSPQKSRGHVTQELEGLREMIGIPASNGRKSEGMLQTLPVPTAKSYMFHWDTDNFDILNTILEQEHDSAGLPPSEEDEEGEEEEGDPDEDEEVGAEVYLEEGEEEESGLEDYNSMSFIPNGYDSDHRASTLSTVSSLSTASKDSMYSTVSVASRSSAPSYLSTASGVDSDFFEDPDDCSSSSTSSSTLPAHGKNSKSAKGRLSLQFPRFLQFSRKPPKNINLVRARSLGSPESRNLLAVTSKRRSNSLPQQVHLRSTEPGHQTLRHVCFRRRPILSSDEDGKQVTLRVAVFGADHMAGKVARAYSSLRRREDECPHLSRAFRLQFYFVPVKRDGNAGGAVVPGAGGPKGPSPSGSPLKGANLNPLSTEDSTNDIARFVGMLDPWYERNTLSLLNLPASVVCQQTSKTESESYDNSYEQPLPILVDLVLYYCRHADRPALIQLYQAELTLAGGERKTEVLIHSLELGHTAGTRAVKAMGAARKRFGIDGDREAVPLKLEVVYNRVVISGRSLWKRADKQYTSITLTKACKNPEELDSKMECLQLTMTEVLKRQNSKSKKGYNQLSVTEVKVDKVHVTGGDNTTFAVCLDQDEKKIFQSVTKCEVSVCYKPDSSSDWRLGKTLPGQIQPLNPTFCSLLCLPIATFSGAQP